jgi:hypothetical protein
MTYYYHYLMQYHQIQTNSTSTQYQMKPSIYDSNQIIACQLYDESDQIRSTINAIFAVFKLFCIHYLIYYSANKWSNWNYQHIIIDWLLFLILMPWISTYNHLVNHIDSTLFTFINYFIVERISLLLQILCSFWSERYVSHRWSSTNIYRIRRNNQPTE